jgi:hypothetical protein
MTTTNQKKNTTIAGIAYPPTVLALATAFSYPAPPGLSATGILGGPACDALIAFTAAEHQATLLSLDQRATATYEAIGATVEQLAP